MNHRQIWMLISGIGCLLVGISAQGIQRTVSSPDNRHLLFSNLYYAAFKTARKDNSATSPLGIDELLLMITLAANEHHKTFKQLNQSILLPPTPEEFRRSRESVTELLRQRFEDVNLTIANLMYINQKVRVLDSYQNSLSSHFSARCTKMDFGDPQAAVREINDEVASLTNEKIRNSISPRLVHEDTWAILMNVMYFDGKWKTPFEKSLTKPRSFFCNEQNWLDVPTMYVKGPFKRFDDSGMKATVVEMPYKNENFSMSIIVPTENTTLRGVEMKLQLSALFNESANARVDELELYLPKFKFESLLNLQPTLKKMGIKELFDLDADLSKMTPSVGVYISRIQQGVFLEVKEEGAEAAAGSTSPAVDNNTRPSVNVDRPFLAILRYKDLDLFMARITDPRF